MSAPKIKFNNAIGYDRMILEHLLLERLSQCKTIKNITSKFKPKFHQHVISNLIWVKNVNVHETI